MSSFPKLAFPNYEFRIRETGQNKQIFDCVRKRFVALTPEEWVRQNLIRYLNEQMKFPLSLMAVEKMVKVNRMRKRADIVLYNEALSPLMIAECKSPGTSLSQSAFDQVARYGLTLKITCVLVTNGISHVCAEMKHDTQSYQFLKEIPDYFVLTNPI